MPHINITQELIFLGDRGDPLHCPATKACIQAGMSYPVVTHNLVLTRRFFYRLPSNLVDWIDKWDSGKEVRPFSCELIEEPRTDDRG